MKKCFILICCMVVSLQIKAQNIGSPSSVSNSFSWVSGNGNQSNNDTIYNSANSGELENRFLGGSAFREGELRTRKGLITTELSYRFDQLAGTVEVKKQDGTTMHLNEKDILYCKIFYGKDVHTFMPVALPNEKQLTLLQVIYKTPTLQLYRHIRKIVKFQRDSYSYSNPSGNNELTVDLKNDYSYYIRKGDKELLQEVSITTKSFIKALPEKEKTIIRLFNEAKKRDNLTVSTICKMMGKLDKKAEIE
jgi:hypothetical protein